MADILDSESLIRRLRELRKIQGRSAESVADAAGISRNSIANMESGRKSTVSIDQAAAICRALGVDLRVVLSSEPMPVVI